MIGCGNKSKIFMPFGAEIGRNGSLSEVREEKTEGSLVE